MYILEYVQALLQVPPQQTPATPTYPSGSTTDTTPFTETYGKESRSGKTTTTASSTSPNDRT